MDMVIFVLEVNVFKDLWIDCFVYIGGRFFIFCKNIVLS